jgi:2,3-dihydro-2,3-dihydroxybenzoate dehydrogenase
MLRLIEAEQSKDQASAMSLREQRAASIPDGRYAQPAEVANLMVYLASDYASHVTGQGVQINGGSHA